MLMLLHLLTLVDVHTNSWSLFRIRNQISCSVLEISCPYHTVIDIAYTKHWAFVDHTCTNGQTNKRCSRAMNVLDSLSRRCNGERSCTVDPRALMYSTECSSHRQCLKVLYTCEYKPSESERIRKTSRSHDGCDRTEMFGIGYPRVDRTGYYSIPCDYPCHGMLGVHCANGRWQLIEPDFEECRCDFTFKRKLEMSDFWTTQALTVLLFEKYDRTGILNLVNAEDDIIIGWNSFAVEVFKAMPINLINPRWHFPLNHTSTCLFQLQVTSESSFSHDPNECSNVDNFGRFTVKIIVPSNVNAEEAAIAVFSTENDNIYHRNISYRIKSHCERFDISIAIDLNEGLTCDSIAASIRDTQSHCPSRSAKQVSIISGGLKTSCHLLAEQVHIDSWIELSLHALSSTFDSNDHFKISGPISTESSSLALNLAAAKSSNPFVAIIDDTPMIFMNGKAYTLKKDKTNGVMPSFIEVTLPTTTTHESTAPAILMKTTAIIKANQTTIDAIKTTAETTSEHHQTSSEREADGESAVTLKTMRSTRPVPLLLAPAVVSTALVSTSIAPTIDDEIGAVITANECARFKFARDESGNIVETVGNDTSLEMVQRCFGQWIADSESDAEADIDLSILESRELWKVFSGGSEERLLRNASGAVMASVSLKTMSNVTEPSTVSTAIYGYIGKILTRGLELLPASQLISINLQPRQSPVQVTITAATINESLDCDHRVCVFWNENIDHNNITSKWSRKGCKKTACNRSHTTCSCSHLTAFMVLFDFYGVLDVEDELYPDVVEHRRILSAITLYGAVTSFLFLLATLIILIAFRSRLEDPMHRYKLHINLVACLLVVQVFLMMACIGGTTQDSWCTMSGVLLHYFLLASFMWMFLDGAELVSSLTSIAQWDSPRYVILHMAGYGIPGAVVSMTLLVGNGAYSNKHICWLRPGITTVVAFGIPVLVILLANICSFGLILHQMKHYYARSHKRKSRHSSLKVWLRNAICLFILLGMTWFLGFVVFDRQMISVAYIFTVLNSLCGVWIFVAMCILKPTIYAALEQWITEVCCCMEMKYEISRYTNTAVNNASRMFRNERTASNIYNSTGNGVQTAEQDSMQPLNTKTRTICSTLPNRDENQTIYFPISG